MINILLLTCGTNASFHFSKVIKEKFNTEFKIIGTDINEEYLVPSCIYLDKFYKVPYSTDDNYYEIILAICKKENINYIIASFDDDQRLFYSGNKDLENLGVKSLAITKDVLNMYKTKSSMNDFLVANNLPIPKNYDIQELEDHKKYILKPINGCGSIGVEVLNKTEILKKQNISEYLIQEVCCEPEITLECFYYNKKLSTIARERIASKAGVCTKTKVFNNIELEKLAYKFANSFNCPTFFNLQFMKNSIGEYVITDVNLRLAGGMSLSYVAGWDEISAIAKIMLNRDITEIFETLPNKIQEQYIVRAYADIVTKKVKSVVAFDLDGTLLDSRERHKIVLDYILSKKDIKLDTSNLIDFKRTGKNNIDFLIENGVEESLAKVIQQEWIENIEKPEFLQNDKLYPDTISLIQKYLPDNDLILVTARKNKEGCMEQLKNLGIDKFFKDIYIVEPCKNTSELKAEILQSENVILMIGDTEVDKKAANINKCGFLWVEHGFRNICD